MQFTTQQQQTLQAAVNRLIPADDYPGAWEAGVGEYLARQFEGDLQPAVETYRAALDGLDAEARAQYGSGFAELDTAQQDALLQVVEQGAVTTAWTVPPDKFLRLLVEHTAQGYYSHPLHGGNRDARSWEMVGFSNRTE